MYEATPPLEAMRPLITELSGREYERKSMDIAPGDDDSSVLNVHRVYLYAQAVKCESFFVANLSQTRVRLECGQVRMRQV